MAMSPTASDSFRSYLESPASNEWCNAKNTGIGHRPATNTGIDMIPYYLWIKVPVKSDGECYGHGADSMIGPKAGYFFKDGFKQLWNNGFFVRDKGAAPV